MPEEPTTDRRCIEDYAVIGDMETVALIDRDASIDWLCLPRFDSGAAHAALVGDEQNGRWQIHPAGEVTSRSRRYVGDSMVLETEFQTPTGIVRVVDAMPPRGRSADVVRMVVGVQGSVEMELRWTLRFEYGLVIPWVMHDEDRDALIALAGPNAVALYGDILPSPLGDSQVHGVTFTIGEGQRRHWSEQWYSSLDEPPEPINVSAAIRRTQRWWHNWASHCTYQGPYRDAVLRSLLTLKSLTHAPTGGIVAAATTSLPESMGGERNWDYRYCWLRDATMTLSSMVSCGYLESAGAFSAWLQRVIAGSPSNLQIMYSVAGGRHLVEWEADWLAGFDNSRPVRVGNGAFDQLQLDVFGEVINSLFLARQAGLQEPRSAWSIQRALVNYLAEIYNQPDHGVWEVRGPARYFTHSRVMIWLAFDRAVRAVEEQGVRSNQLEDWRRLRDEVHAEVCEKGYNQEIGAFTQYYGGTELDAAVLMIPTVGFLPADDERVVSTLENIDKRLRHGAMVDRYETSQDEQSDVDGLSGKEGAFLATSFWFVDNLVLAGRMEEARQMFEQLLELRNDVGLLAEEYDVDSQHQLGNVPQAYSHLALIHTALLLSGEGQRPMRDD